jgi:hypothetical protein
MQEKCTIHKSKRSNTRKQTRVHKTGERNVEWMQRRGKRTLVLRIRGKMIEDDKHEDKRLISEI